MSKWCFISENSYRRIVTSLKYSLCTFVWIQICVHISFFNILYFYLSAVIDKQNCIDLSYVTQCFEIFSHYGMAKSSKFTSVLFHLLFIFLMKVCLSLLFFRFHLAYNLQVNNGFHSGTFTSALFFLLISSRTFLIPSHFCPPVQSPFHFHAICTLLFNLFSCLFLKIFSLPLVD